VGRLRVIHAVGQQRFADCTEVQRAKDSPAPRRREAWNRILGQEKDRTIGDRSTLDAAELLWKRPEFSSAARLSETFPEPLLKVDPEAFISAS